MLVDDRSSKWATPCMFSVTITMIAIVLGILTGEFITSPERAAQFSGLAATVVALVLGVRVFITAWRTRETLVLMAIPAIWAANILYTLSADNFIVDVLFDIATTLVMFVMYKHVHEHMLLANTLKCRVHFRRRKEDREVCSICSKPCEQTPPVIRD